MVAIGHHRDYGRAAAGGPVHWRVRTWVKLGLLLWLTPGFFYDSIGPYGARNDHYMADVATWYLALGAVALVALRRESWRIPVIALAFVQYALHSLNHLIDVGEADPGWLGPASLVSLALTTILLGAMLRSPRPAGTA
jgi:hypothetical protein